MSGHLALWVAAVDDESGIMLLRERLGKVSDSSIIPNSWEAAYRVSEVAGHLGDLIVSLAVQVMGPRGEWKLRSPRKTRSPKRGHSVIK